jgi:hypothetical protein
MVESGCVTLLTILPPQRNKTRSSIVSCFLGGNADAVEFCPHRPFRHVLAAATYTLQEQDRAGTVSLFSVDAGQEEASQRLRLLHTVETPGVFDMKWSPKSPLLAQADAHARLALRRIEQDDGSDTGIACLFLHLSFLRSSCIGKVSCAPCSSVKQNAVLSV